MQGVSRSDIDTAQPDTGFALPGDEIIHLSGLFLPPAKISIGYKDDAVITSGNELMIRYAISQFQSFATRRSAVSS